MEPAVLDDIIERLLAVKARPGKQVQLSEAEIRQLCVASKDIFLRQPNLLELQAPVKICGTPLLIYLFLKNDYGCIYMNFIFAFLFMGIVLKRVFFNSSICLEEIGCVSVLF